MLKITTSSLKVLAAGIFILGSASISSAGPIFLTGHDPDFHAFLGGNFPGAQHVNQAAISFITDPAQNTFSAQGIDKILFVESSIPIPAGHSRGVDGLVASGFVPGTDFEHHTAATLQGELALLGTKYDALVIASDFGGTLTSAELDILNASAAQIIDFLNAGGGLYAMAESNLGAGLTPNGGQWGFLPFVVASNALDQVETGFTVTAFGASLGLFASDINGNASHNIFLGDFGLNVVDFDAAGNIMSLAGNRFIEPPPTNEIPEPATILLLGLAAGIPAFRRRGNKTELQEALRSKS